MYIVLEIQTAETVATLVFSFTDKNQAEQKYHAVLSAAAVSTVPKHSAVMLDDRGGFIKAECYEHNNVDPQEP